MKRQIFLFFISTIIFKNVFALALSPPFVHQEVSSYGLIIHYDLGDSWVQKLTCIFENFYAGTLIINVNNVKQTNFDFKDNRQFYFSSKERSFHEQGFDQFQVSKVGTLVVRETSSRNTIPFASCFYLP